MTVASPPTHTDTAAALRVIIARIHRRLRPTAAGTAAGLTPTGISVLHAVVRRGPIRLSELAAEEGLNPTMLSRVVGGLAEGGLLIRDSDPGDRRAAFVKASADGKRLAERMRRERTDVLSVALAGLTATERRALDQALPALERLAEALKERRP